MLLRCESGELSIELGQWWKKFQDVDNDQREKMLVSPAPAKKRRRNRKRKNATESSSIEANKITPEKP